MEKCSKCHGQGNIFIVVSRPGRGVAVKTRLITCPQCGKPSPDEMITYLSFKVWAESMKSKKDIS